MSSSSTNQKTLVVLAAGMGSRYGGLKQLDPVGPGGETILEFSVFDAIRAGFSKVVFVIRRDFEGAFRKELMSRFERQVDTVCVFQDADAELAPADAERLVANREKPWGTGHALLVAAGAVDGPFAVVNADDFYGADAFLRLGSFLEQMPVHGAPPFAYAMVAYHLANTLSPNGTVSRGICAVNEAGFLQGVTEHKQIGRDAEGAISGTTEVAGETAHPVSLGADTLASMNLFGFSPAFFVSLREQFQAFVAKHGAEPKAEFHLPAAVNANIASGAARVAVLPTNALWYGVTHKADRPAVVEALAALAANGHYPQPLWG